MRNQFKFALVAATMAMGIASPALAQSYSFPTYAYLHPQTVQPDYGTALRGGLYNYIPAQGEQATTWPSAAAMGNSH
jgi:hypothetical protein